MMNTYIFIERGKRAQEIAELLRKGGFEATLDYTYHQYGREEGNVCLRLMANSKSVGFCNLEYYLETYEYIPSDHGLIITGNQFLANPTLVTGWVGLPEPEVRELTVAEISQRLGYPIKVIKG